MSYLQVVTKEEKLIWLYLYICEAHDTTLCLHCQRLSPNSEPEFSDCELMTTYLFSIIEEKHLEIKAIHRFIQKYWSSYFPKLPSYAKYAERLKRLVEVFPVLAEQVLADAPKGLVHWGISIVDSMPIILAQQKRCDQAKVAPEICDKGYCSSKNTWYYGTKLHVLAWRRRQTLPLPEFVGITPASEHDVVAFKRIAPLLQHRQVFGDKAYFDKKLKELLENEQHTTMQTCVRRVKGQQHLPSDHKLFSTLVSKVRQPLESLFNWINEKTGIQTAAKVRSFAGLQIHVFGKLTAAFFLLAFSFLNP
jgi:hypothetical protein